MSKKHRPKYQWHDGFFRFVLNRERDCVVDLVKLLACYGSSSGLQDLLALVDWQRSEQATDAFFEKGGERITFADLVYRLYLVGTDYYFYLLAEHKDRLAGGYRPFLQMDGYAMRIRERDKGKLVLSLLLIGSGNPPQQGNYVDAVLDKIAVPDHMLAVLRQCHRAFATHEQLAVALQRVPDAVLLDGKTFACPAMPYVIKHNKKLARAQIVVLLGLCREMKAQGKKVVMEGILWYAISASGLSLEEWLAIEMEDCPHLAEEELVMYKREFGLETFERELAEHKAEGIEQGKAEGIEKGKAEGIEQGKAEGIEQGKAEGIEKGKLEASRDIALKLLKQGISEAIVCSTTKLSRKEVQLLKKSL